MQQRLQKIIAAAGYCSRRRAEDLIAEGRVRVDGRVAKLGDQADAQKCQVLIDGTCTDEKAAAAVAKQINDFDQMLRDMLAQQIAYGDDSQTISDVIDSIPGMVQFLGVGK